MADIHAFLCVVIGLIDGQAATESGGLADLDPAVSVIADDSRAFLAIFFSPVSGASSASQMMEIDYSSKACDAVVSRPSVSCSLSVSGHRTTIQNPIAASLTSHLSVWWAAFAEFRPAPPQDSGSLTCTPTWSPLLPDFSVYLAVRSTLFQ